MTSLASHGIQRMGHNLTALQGTQIQGKEGATQGGGQLKTLPATEVVVLCHILPLPGHRRRLLDVHTRWLPSASWFASPVMDIHLFIPLPAVTPLTHRHLVQLPSPCVKGPRLLLNPPSCMHSHPLEVVNHCSIYNLHGLLTEQSCSAASSSRAVYLPSRSRSPTVLRIGLHYSLRGTLKHTRRKIYRIGRGRRPAV